MNLRKFAFLILLGVCGFAHSQIVTIVEAVEVSRSNISVPTSANGRMMFKPCAGKCDAKFVAVRLTPATRYFVDQKPVDFLGFRAAFFNSGRGTDDYALVSYEKESNTATSVNLGS